MPQAVLSAVLICAVISLIDVRSMMLAWKSHRHDGIAALGAFSATLVFAPSLDRGILVGAGIAIVLYLYRTMKPRVAVLGRHADGTLRDARLHNLPTSEHIIVLRYDGSLYFANVPYFEDAVLNASARNAKAKFLLVVGDGINEIDASGQETVRHLVERLREGGVTVTFSGLKQQVLNAIQATGLYAVIGAQNLFRTEDAALEAIYQQIHDDSFDATYCPLKPAGPAGYGDVLSSER
jgi:sulfate permease, SulP family